MLATTSIHKKETGCGIIESVKSDAKRSCVSNPAKIRKVCKGVWAEDVFAGRLSPQPKLRRNFGLGQTKSVPPHSFVDRRTGFKIVDLP